MSDIIDLVPALQRSIAVPGGFDEAFPTASTGDLVGLLMDAIAGAQLDGFLPDVVVDPLLESVTPDLSNGEALNAHGALVVLYASHQLLMNEVRNRRNHVRYEAGSAVFEEDQTASMLNELLRESKSRIDDLKQARDRGDLATTASVYDLNFIRSTTDYGATVAPLYVSALEAWGY